MPRGFTARAVVRYNNIPALVIKMQLASKQAVQNAAHEVQTRAQQLAAVDTGAMRASIYVNDGEDSDYQQAATQARQLNPRAVILDEIDPEFVISPSGGQDPDYTAVVGVAAGHGIFNEYGTVHMRPQPFLIPAALSTQDDFTTGMSRIADG
jgi:HK97 gp10 family phage protein